MKCKRKQKTLIVSFKRGVGLHAIFILKLSKYKTMENFKPAMSYISNTLGSRISGNLEHYQCIREPKTLHTMLSISGKMYRSAVHSVIIGRCLRVGLNVSF